MEPITDPELAAEAIRKLTNAQEYIYNSRRVNSHFQGNRRDYDNHNWAISILFRARLEAEKVIKSFSINSTIQTENA